MIKNRINFICMLLVMVVTMASCIEEDYFGKSAYNRIISFSLPLQLTTASIDHDSLLIRIAVSDESDLSALKPVEIKISNFATLTPGVAEARDFSDPVVYTVTAEDGTKVEYTVIVTTDAPRIQLPNSGFDNWYTASGNYPQIGTGPNDTVWCTGNAGVVTLGSANVLPVLLNGQDTVAQLNTVLLGTLPQLIGQGIAAGSMFTGTFVLNIQDPVSSARFGTPFIGRPDSFSVVYRYTPGIQMYNGYGQQISGQDSLDIAVLLEDRSTTPTKRVATVWFRSGETTSDFVQLKLPLIYGQVPDPKPHEIPEEGAVWGTGNEKPTHISVIFSSSSRGDFFEGAPGSELIVNDFLLFYPE